MPEEPCPFDEPVSDDEATVVGSEMIEENSDTAADVGKPLSGAEAVALVQERYGQALDILDDGRVSVTLKAGKNYDVPWIVLEGPTVASVLRKFTDEGPDLEKLIEQTIGAALTFQMSYEKRSGGLPPSRTIGKPRAASEPSGGQESPPEDPQFDPKSAPPVQRVCDHGQMNLVEAKGKRGFVCSQPPGQRCPPIFV